MCGQFALLNLWGCPHIISTSKSSALWWRSPVYYTPPKQLPIASSTSTDCTLCLVDAVCVFYGLKLVCAVWSVPTKQWGGELRE
jgi:hypothetical protein